MSQQLLRTWIVCIVLGSLFAAVAAGQDPGEHDLHRQEEQTHHLPIVPLNHSDVWPAILQSAMDPSHVFHLHPFPVDDPAAAPSSGWLARYGWDQLTEFPSLAHPSLCFHNYFDGADGTNPIPWRGAKPNLDPMAGASPPTLPPLSGNTVLGTSPLIPAGADAGLPSMFSIAERVMLGGVVDAATGGAALRHIDLELPFGGAVFRHVRTYMDSTSLTGGGLEHETTYMYDKAMTRLWDWNGTGWMVGHNPILLIDSGLPGVTELIEDDSDEKFYQRRCYFIPDAHHSIPFDMRTDGAMPVYEAPARFGATLSYEGGVWDSTMYNGLGGWSEFPWSYTVWLNNGAVKYVISPIYEDIKPLPEVAGSRFSHQRHGTQNPSDGDGYGIPYLGLTVRIEDRYGNKIINEYCGFRQYDCEVERADPSDPPGTFQPDATGTPPGSFPTVLATASSTNDPPDHRVLCQTCHQKGQLGRTLLFPAGSADPAWTIVYSHRTFAAYDITKAMLDIESLRYPYLNQSAISTIRVYRGAKTPESCLTLDFRAFHPPDTTVEDFTCILDVPSALPTGDGPDDWADPQYNFESGSYDGEAHLSAIVDRLDLIQQLRHPDLDNPSAGCGDDWTHEVHYVYSDSSDLFRENPEVFLAGFVGDVARAVAGDLIRPTTPRLLTAITSTRLGEADPGTGEIPVRTDAYAYRYAVHNQDRGGTYFLASPSGDAAVLSAVFTPTAISSIRDAMVRADDPEWPWATHSEVAHYVAVDDYDSTIPSPEPVGFTTSGGVPVVSLRQSASHYFGRWYSDDDVYPTQIDMHPSDARYLVPGLRRTGTLPIPDGDERSFGWLYNNDGSDVEPLSSAMSSSYFHEMVDMLDLSSPEDELALLTGDVAVATSPASGASQPTRKIYRFIHLPAEHPAAIGRILDGANWACRVANPGLGGTWFDGEALEPDRALWHFPHRLYTEGRLDQFETAPVLAALGETAHGLDRPLWYIVVDTYPTQRSALLPVVTGLAPAVWDSGFSNLPVLGGPATGDWAGRRPVSRQIIALNAMGYRVWDREYSVTPSGIDLVDGNGHRLAYVHDEDGRLSMVKSYGWSATELKDPATTDSEGLVTVYDYEYPSGSELEGSTEPRRVGVQWGDNGDEARADNEIHWLREFYRDAARPEVVLAEVTFDYEPDSSGTYAGGYVLPGDTSSGILTSTHMQLRNATFHEVEFDGSSSEFTKAIKWRASAQSPAPIEPSGTPLFAVSAEAFDAAGRRTALGYGLVADVGLPGGTPGDIFYVDWTHYDVEGRPLIELKDVDPIQTYPSYFTGASPAIPAADPSLPAAWTAQRPVLLPLFDTKQTSYYYDSRGLKRVQYPNDSEKYIARRSLPDQEVEVTTYEGPVDGPAVPDVSGTPSFHTALTSVDRKVYQGRSLIRTEQLARDDGLAIDPDLPGELDVIVTIEPKYDASGNPASISADAQGNSLEYNTAYNQYGTVDRTKELDGTISRKVHDELGRLTRWYRGTSDWSYQFGAPPTTPLTEDNMALVELRAYGEDVRNARLVTDIWSFRDHPDPPDKYSQDASTLTPYANRVRIGHDWRMREVLHATFGVGGAPLETIEVSYLDPMGRSRFEAVFEPTVVGTETDPNAMLDGSGIPGDFVPSDPLVLPSHVTSASTFDGVTGLRRLTESTYNPRGEVQEVRQYDLTAASGMPYTATRTFYDHLGNAVWTESPGGGVVETFYDAHGREVVRSHYAGTLEVSRVTTQYNADDQPIVITTHDRVDDSVTGTLDATNAVVTQTHQWYEDGALICVAELGTSHSADHYATASTPPSVWGAPTPAPPSRVDGTTVTISAGSEYADALVTAYGYDKVGNQEYVLHPDRTVTRSRYDGWGNVNLVQEGIELQSSGANWTMTTPARTTFYEYVAGRLVRVGTLLPPHAVASSPSSETALGPLDGYQITEIAYDAKVVRWTGTLLAPQMEEISQNNQWIGEIRFPGDEDPAVASYTYQYYVDGSIASRQDARGVSLFYLYDAQGRIEQVIADYDDIDLPPFDGGDVVPADRIQRIDYGYDEATGEMTEATAYGLDTDENWYVVSESTFEYDEDGRLLKEYQQRGDHVLTASTPYVGYEWDVTHATTSDTGFVRLDELTYPVRYDDGPLPPPLTLAFDYGSSGSADDILSRITRINDKTTGAAVALAEFVHTGTGMRVRRSVHDPIGDAIAVEGSTNDDSSDVGYEHLDRFGRVTDLHWRDDDVTPATLYRSQHTLDELGQRTGAEITRVDLSTSAPEANTNSWAYDFDALRRLVAADLGQLTYPSGDPAVSSPTTGHLWTLDELGNWSGDGSLSGLSITGVGARDVTHTVGDFNEVESATVDSTTTSFVYDGSGNLVYDGVYWYRYDAWHRLIQVVEAPSGGFTFVDGVMTGSGPAFADVVVVYAYDALGRLVGRQAPYPGTTDEWRTETYFYDGDRRIAERWRDPIINNNGGGSNGNQQNQAPTHTQWTEREYVYTPGYIDEFVCEVDALGEKWPILQGANFNAVAMLDEDGTLVRQRIYGPYGRVMSLDDHATITPPKSRVGHQGLFAERLDADTQQEPQWDGATLAWQNRNRTLLPEIGRFAQRDPNSTGQGARRLLNSHGSTIYDGPSASDVLEYFGDGMNVYAYAMASPTQNLDPTGLFIDIGMPGPGDFVTGALEGIVNAYAGNLDWDVEWASDWTLPDDFHTRGDDSWIMLAALQGIYGEFEIGFGSYSFNPLDAFAGGGKRTDRIRTKFGSGRFLGTVTLGRFKAYRYTSPKGGRSLVKFDRDSVFETVRVNPSNSAKERSDAVKALNKKGFTYNPKKHALHHHWVSGEIQVVPRALHKQVGHQGRAFGWPVEVK